MSLHICMYIRTYVCALCVGMGVVCVLAHLYVRTYVCVCLVCWYGSCLCPCMFVRVCLVCVCKYVYSEASLVHSFSQKFYLCDPERDLPVLASSVTHQFLWITRQ